MIIEHGFLGCYDFYILASIVLKCGEYADWTMSKMILVIHQEWDENTFLSNFISSNTKTKTARSRCQIFTMFTGILNILITVHFRRDDDSADFIFFPHSPGISHFPGNAGDR